MTDDPRWPPLMKRLEQAAQRCTDLNAEFDAFRAEPGVTWPGEENDERTEVVLTPIFEDPWRPIRWGLLLGEMVHQCRSALDNVAWQLALEATAPDDPPRTTCFPICDTRSEFHRMKGTEPHPNSGRAKVAALPPQAQAIVERHQPFHQDATLGRPALSILRDLHDGDKHRVPVVSGIHAEELGFRVAMELADEDGSFDMAIDPRGDSPIRHGVPAVAVKNPSPWTSITVEVDVQARFQFGVGPGQWFPAQQLVTSMLVQTAFVFHDMAGFFGANPTSAYDAATVPS